MRFGECFVQIMGKPINDLGSPVLVPLPSKNGDIRDKWCHNTDKRHDLGIRYDSPLQWPHGNRP